MKEYKFAIGLLVIAIILTIIDMVMVVESKYYILTGDSEQVCGHIDIIEGVEYCSVSPIKISDFE